MSELQIEYYDPALNKDGSQRSFSYTWAGDHAADTLLIEIQQPLDATDTTITPGPVSNTVGSDGLNYFYKNIGAVEINQSFTLQASYQKESDALTVETQPVESTTPLTTYLQLAVQPVERVALVGGHLGSWPDRRRDLLVLAFRSAAPGTIQQTPQPPQPRQCCARDPGCRSLVLPSLREAG